VQFGETLDDGQAQAGAVIFGRCDVVARLPEAFEDFCDLVRFDADASSRKFTQSKELERRAAVGDTCQEAYVYAFQYEAANRSFITLNRVR